RAEVVRVPAVAGLTEFASLACGLRRRLGNHDAGLGIGYRVGDFRAFRVVLDAVVVVEIAETPDSGLPVVVVELMVAGRGMLHELERAPILVEGALEVRVVAVLVLLVAEDRPRGRVSSPQPARRSRFAPYHVQSIHCPDRKYRSSSHPPPEHRADMRCRRR